MQTRRAMHVTAEAQTGEVQLRARTPWTEAATTDWKRQGGSSLDSRRGSPALIRPTP